MHLTLIFIFGLESAKNFIRRILIEKLIVIPNNNLYMETTKTETNEAINPMVNKLVKR